MKYHVTVKGFKSGLNELLSGKIYDYRTKKYRNPVKNRNDALCAKFIKLSKELNGIQICMVVCNITTMIACKTFPEKVVLDMITQYMKG